MFWDLTVRPASSSRDGRVIGHVPDKVHHQWVTTETEVQVHQAGGGTSVGCYGDWATRGSVCVCVCVGLISC